MRLTERSVEPIYKEALPTIEVICTHSDLEFVKQLVLYHGAICSWEYIIDTDDIVFVAPKELDNKSYENWRATLLVIESAYFLGSIGKVNVSLLPNCTAIRVVIKTDDMNFTHMQDALKELLDVEV
jgi:hypothetical protein